MIDRVQFTTGPATGSAGSATATGHSPHVKGHVLAVHIAYQDSPPAASTDLTLTDADDPASENIVTLTNAATDIKLYPRRQLETNDGTDLTYDGTRKVYGHYTIHGRLKATIAQANAGDSCTITAWIRT